MMTIGEFAQTTGLTVKALRFYDEKGLLAPAETDPSTGYRRYETQQVKRGAIISVLRSMGLPLAQVECCLAAPDQQHEVLNRYRQEVLLERERQDRIWGEGQTVLDQYEEERALLERPAAALPWAGVVCPLPASDEDTTAEERFDRFVTSLTEHGTAVKGPFWTTFRSSEDCRAVEMVLAIGLGQPLPESLDPGNEVVSGMLPERTERYVRIDPGFGMSMDLPAPHPGVVALLAAGASDPVENLRQTVVSGTRSESAIELVIDVR